MRPFVRSLAEDDAAVPGNEPYKVRETPDWRKWATDIEDEIASRGVVVRRIDWTTPWSRLTQ